MKNTNEKGRSLLEMLAVIGIITVITLGSITGVSFITRYYEATRLYSEVDEIANNILDMYSWSKTFTGLSTEIACKNDVFEQCRGTGDKTVGISPWGGNITVTGEEDTFSIVYEDVNNFICNQIEAHLEDFNTVVPHMSNCDSIQDITFKLRL